MRTPLLPTSRNVAVVTMEKEMAGVSNNDNSDDNNDNNNDNDGGEIASAIACYRRCCRQR